MNYNISEKYFDFDKKYSPIKKDEKDLNISSNSFNTEIKANKNASSLDKIPGFETRIFSGNLSLLDKLGANRIKIPQFNHLLNNIKYSCDQNLNIKATISFNQDELIQKGLPKKLDNFVLRFDGLCELICNKVLIENLLGQGKSSRNFLKEKINIDGLNKETILKSHSLDMYSVLDKILAFLFRIYPDNIFSFKDQLNLVQKNKEDKNLFNVNKNLLFDGLRKIEDGVILKVQVFKKTRSSFKGHALLIKKVSAKEFIFFDPNTGEHPGLNEEELAERINKQLAQWKATDIFLSKGESFIKRLKEKKY
jgi:hypothetical protein